MKDELKQVWAASAAVETLQVEMDQAQALLQDAIDEASQAGTDPEAIDDAAQLTAPTLSQPADTEPTEPH